MPTLRELVAPPEKRAAVVDDCLHVLDLEVQDKGGLGGMAIKGAYKLVKGVRPGFVREAVDHLLDDFLDALDPIYQEALNGELPPGDHLRSSQSRMADLLLGVTDRRAEKAKMAAIKKAYEKLRPSAKKHVEAAAPRLGELLAKHVPG